MTIEQKTEIITGFTEQLISNQPSCFLVGVQLRKGNNIQVLLDADEGLSLSQCVTYNRALYKLIEEAALFPPGEFALEVSSPGLDEPLKLPRQYAKNIGRQVEVVLKDGRKLTGKLLSAGEPLVVEEIKGKGKKQEIIQHSLLSDQIKTTKIQIVF